MVSTHQTTRLMTSSKKTRITTRSLCQSQHLKVNTSPTLKWKKTPEDMRRVTI